MYIEPSTNIRLLKNVPIDKSYKHTLYFENKTEQYNYFVSKTKHNLTRQTYQRVNLGIMRINLKPEVVYDCNYLMFQNEGFGNKWFYAFITKVEYVNNVVCQIHFEIDVMQTWFLDCTIKQSFVEREHSETDEIGDNILPERVELGEYVHYNQKELTNAINPMAVVVAVVDTEGEISSGGIYDGVYSGVKYYCFNSDDVKSIDALMSKYLFTPDNILSMYMCPVIVCSEGVIDRGTTTIIENTKEGWSYTVDLNRTFVGKFGEYTPKNNKMYTYPFNFISINNNNGSEMILRKEFFSGSPTVRLDSCLSMPVKITCRPYNYKGVEGAYNNEFITLENYPMCSWNMDSYKVWLAQNCVPYIAKGVSQMAKAIAIPSVSKSGVGRDIDTQQAMSNSIDYVENFATSAYTASIQADMCKGSINSGNINIAHEMQNFFVTRCHISESHARYIDSFFTVYGYACRRVKKPNINSRPHWNYVKTIDSVVVGSAPSDDIAKIRALFDRGITFWKKGDEVGNYTLDNSPT